jgi:hypothetical protein
LSDGAGWHSGCYRLGFVFHRKRGMRRLGEVIGDRADPSCVVRNVGMVMGRVALQFCCKLRRGRREVIIVFGGNPVGKAFVKS